MRCVSFWAAAAVLALSSLHNVAAVSVRGATPPIPRWGGNDTTVQWSAYVNMTDPADSVSLPGERPGQRPVTPRPGAQPAYPTWMFNYYYDGLSNVSR